MLSDHERRRFDLIVADLVRDDSVSRLDVRGPAAAKRATIRGGRRRGILEWAGRRFAVRMRRDRGW